MTDRTERDPNPDSGACETPIVDLLRNVPVADGWRTYSEKPDDPMAGSHLHGDLLERAAAYIEALEAKVGELTEERDEARAIVDDNDDSGDWLRSRCPACGHRLRGSASACPQCFMPFLAPWHYDDGNLPDECECERCQDARAALPTPQPADEESEDG